jgi:hypothetical protein
LFGAYKQSGAAQGNFLNWSGGIGSLPVCCEQIRLLERSNHDSPFEILQNLVT